MKDFKSVYNIDNVILSVMIINANTVCVQEMRKLSAFFEKSA